MTTGKWKHVSPLRRWALATALLGALVPVMSVLGCGLTISIDGDDPGVEETREDSFEVGRSARVVVDSFNGSIQVSAGPEGVINVQADLRRAERIEYMATQAGDIVRVEARRVGALVVGQSPGADITVSAPAGTVLDIDTSNGAIEVRDLEAAADLDTSNGNITVVGARGRIKARTSNGTIDVSGFQGSAELESSNGPIRFSGDLEAGTENEIRTSNGRIDVTIEGTPSIALDASTSNGRVTSELPISVVRSERGELVGTIGDGDAELEVSTSNGSIVIR